MGILWLCQILTCGAAAFGVSMAYVVPNAVSVGCATFSVLTWASATLFLTRRG